MEIENKLTVTRGVMGERRGRGKTRNMNRRLMGTDNRVGIDCEGKEGGAGETKGAKSGATVIEQQ